ncbi:hypothetical protein PS3A_10840 [Pseudomonas sp. 3A(2025)]
MGRFGIDQLALDIAQQQVAVEHIVDGQALEGFDFLAHVRDTPVGRQVAIAGIGAQLATQQSEEAGFTGAIGTDQTGFLAGVQGQLGVF